MSVVTIGRFVRAFSGGKSLDGEIRKLDEAIEDGKKFGANVADLEHKLKTLQGLQGAAKDSGSDKLKETGRSAAHRANTDARDRNTDALWKKVDGELAEFKLKAAWVGDDWLKPPVQQTLVKLTKGRAKLGKPSADRFKDMKAFEQEMRAALAQVKNHVDFSTNPTKGMREEIRHAAIHYRLAGEKLAQQKDANSRKIGAELIQAAGTMAPGLADAEQMSRTNPAQAMGMMSALYMGTYMKAKDAYESALAPKLNAEVDRRARAFPNGPEAKLRAVLPADQFQKRLLGVYNVAQTFGMSEINLLSPGQAVAIFSYTTEDYKHIQPFLLRGEVPPGMTARGLQTLVDEIKNALTKLEPNSGPTARGEYAWPPLDEQQFALGNKFKLKIFWSTGSGYAFPGEWQITVKGKSGRNVAAMSRVPHEAEVLYPPGTEFKVTAWKQVGKTKYVTVEEV